ncbi:helix-turn-helix domain-containing protein [Idiomarina sp.]|uniref:helix-turn-helix domain-containing protein n=1 Tax=Idiomarina sp. TaxID=1874361 RepID=UPI003A8EA2A7
MIKKLRERKNWSQEQLAIMSGLSVRTIQRIESGNKASMESLKSLASVFEIDVSKLTEEITVIDKESKYWKQQPVWFKLSLFGVNRRNKLVWVEYLSVLLGLVTWIIHPDIFATSAFFLVAYLISKLVNRADSRKIW